MSTSFDPEEYAISEDGPDAPLRLCRFVRDEVRPLLLQHRQTVQEAWARCLAWHDERIREQEAWDARRREFMQQQAALPEEQRQRDSEPSAEGMSWFNDFVQMADGKTVRVNGWVPLDLRLDSRPTLEHPLPPPRGRDLSPDECWADLLAVHDVARDRSEWLVPVDSVLYQVMRSLALRLTEAQLPELRLILKKVTPLPALDSAGRPLPPARHSVDFRHVHWYGNDCYFTPTQAACVRVLWEEWDRGTPEVGQDTILEHPGVEAESKRLSDVFKGSPAWLTLIVQGHTAGAYRLVDPPADG
jgi:hypothetical protein